MPPPEPDLARLLTDLSEMHAGGVITDDEFTQAKGQLLGLPPRDTDPHAGTDPDLDTARRGTAAIDTADTADTVVADTVVAGPVVAGPVVAGPVAGRGASGRRRWGITAAVVVAIGLVAAVVAILVSDQSEGGAPDRPVAASPVASPTPARAVLPERESVEQMVARDRAQVESLVGSWVAQVSAKRVGLVAGGITYGYDDIARHVEDLGDRFGGVMVLRSDDYASFRQGGFYIVIASLQFSSGEDALRWCASEGLGRDDCFAKRLTHTGSADGNTLYQR